MVVSSSIYLLISHFMDYLSVQEHAFMIYKTKEWIRKMEYKHLDGYSLWQAPRNISDEKQIRNPEFFFVKS